VTAGDSRIRHATTADLEALLACWLSLVAHGREHGLHLRTDANRTIARETLAAAIADDRAFVADEDDAVVGFCSLSLERGGFDRDAPRGVVENLYVDPGARGDGLGSALLAAGEDRLRELGAEIVAVETMAADEAAGEFYAERGYAPHRLTLEKRVETNR